MVKTPVLLTVTRHLVAFGAVSMIPFVVSVISISLLVVLPLVVTSCKVVAKAFLAAVIDVA